MFHSNLTSALILLFMNIEGKGVMMIIEVEDVEEELASFIENKISGDLCFSKKCCIFETPKILSRHNRRAFTPNAFSIGPIHHRDQKLQPTQKIKLKYLQGLVRRAHSPKTILGDFIREISNIEPEVREYYGGLRDFDDSKEFVEMLVIDGVFLIELFRKDAQQQKQQQQQQQQQQQLELGDNKDDPDPVFSMSCIFQFLYHDLILLENQIPWIVLEKLFEMTKQDDNDNANLVELAIGFFGNIFSSDTPSIDPELLRSHNKSKHILDLLRSWLVTPILQKMQNIQESAWETFPSATQIKEAGIIFRRPKKAKSILDIKFRKGVLEIPNLLIQETTETILRNLISLEQCCPDCPPIVTSYAIVLDNLINSVKDVRILCKKGIIDSWLNPEDATEFFRKLYLDAYVKKFYYLEVCKKVNVYRKRILPRLRAAYVHYFGTPWAIVSQIVGGVILVLTALQTVYSIINK